MHAEINDIEGLNNAITLVEKFLINEGLEGLDQITNPALRNEVQCYYIPLMQKNLNTWKALADSLMQNAF